MSYRQLHYHMIRGTLGREPWITPQVEPVVHRLLREKAVASTRLNKSGLLQHSFFWQEDFGLFSFDRKRLPAVVAYVEAQKQHHAAGTTIPALERFPSEKLDSSSASP